jgi:hypothetical protein
MIIISLSTILLGFSGICIGNVIANAIILHKKYHQNSNVVELIATNKVTDGYIQCEIQ